MDRLVKISDLFYIKYGNSLELINLVQCKSSEPNSVPFISRTENNNGVSAFFEEELLIDKNPAHTLSVAVSGSVMSSFYQKLAYYSGRDLYVLIPKKEFTVIEMLFYAYCLQLNKYKYNYGRQSNKTIKDLLVPNEMPEKFKNIKTKITDIITQTIKFEL